MTVPARRRATAIALFAGSFLLVYAVQTGAAGAAWASLRVALITHTPDRLFLADARNLQEAAETWFLHTVAEDGSMQYSYNPKTGHTTSGSDGVNDVRLLLAARHLAELCAVGSDADTCAKHRANLTYLMRAWYREGPQGAYVEFDGKSKLGAIADLLRTMVASPYFSEYKRQAAALAKTILFLQNADGSFRPWYIEPRYTYYADHLITFYAGQAQIALIEYYEKTGDAEALASAVKAQEFYIDRYVTHMRANYYPSAVPWQTGSLAKLYAIRPERRYAEAIFALTDRLLLMQDRRDELGRFSDPKTPQYGDPHSSTDGVDTEGLVYALKIAEAEHDTARADRYRKALKLSLYNLRSLQYTDDPYGRTEAEERFFMGALRSEKGNSWIRIDTTEHALDALALLLPRV